MNKAERPWVKWYWSDWRADPGLRVCSLAARGLWAELLGIMQEAEPYGHLLIGGVAPTSKQIASLVGATAAQVEALLAELKRAGVPSETPEGVIYSRRMVRDRERQERDKANGKRGGNPSLNGGVNPPDKPPDNGVVKAHMPEARSQKETKPDAAPVGAPSVVELRSPEARFYDRAKEILGRSSGGLAAKLLRHFDGVLPRAMASLELASGASDPRQYLGAIIANRDRDDGSGDPRGERGRDWG